MTQAVLRFKQDFREVLIREHRDWWLSNTEPAGTKDLEARLRAQILQEQIDLSPEDIIGFYVPEARQKQPPLILDENGFLNGNTNPITGY